MSSAIRVTDLTFLLALPLKPADVYSATGAASSICQNDSAIFSLRRQDCLDKMGVIAVKLAGQLCQKHA